MWFLRRMLRVVGALKMPDLTLTDQIAGVDNARPDDDGPNGLPNQIFGSPYSVPMLCA